MSSPRYTDSKNFRELSITATGTTTITRRCRITMLTCDNAASGIRYLKIYDKATAATEADTPVFTFTLKTGNLTPETLVFPFGNDGLQLANGLSMRAVTERADNGTTGAGANEVKCQGVYNG